MTLNEVQARVLEIESLGDADPEEAHGLEDDLFIDVLTAIAEGTCDNSQACAHEALKTRLLDFPRWYA